MDFCPVVGVIQEIDRHHGIGHDSDVGYNTRHDRIDMPFNFNTCAKVTSSTTVELSGSQQDIRLGAELCRHESGLKRDAVRR